MQLDLFRTLWGVEQAISEIAETLKQEGYVGVEARIPQSPSARVQLCRDLNAQQLDYIGILFTGGDVIPHQGDGPEQHLERLASGLDAAVSLNPRFVNVLAGNDRWCLSAQVDFFAAAQQLANQRGMICAFETHRATSLYSPWVTLELIRQLPDLRFTTDISHWVVVCERLLNDPADDLSAFIRQVHHIQARVGYPQGPQTPHPGAPEYQPALDFHQQYWQSIWEEQRRQGYSVTTMTTEFGPDGYLHHLPFTDVPVADLWSLNQWMAKQQRCHFEQYSQSI
ncbi:sugar phosphate isomerase/epimerase family protein [Agarivorans sp. QJM3NY_33]|uniref:sugar phosphate isomerase/epimerase family protein n=1 Tax=Agarivorans sp. QJM3NY_33 TaxID=3421432 RepID=UPI003D7D3DB6